MNKRNHYRGRPTRRISVSKEYISDLENQNRALQDQLKLLLGILKSNQDNAMLPFSIEEFKKELKSITGDLNNRENETLDNTAVDFSDEIFINPMDEGSSLDKNFEDLGDEEVSEEDQSAKKDRLKKLLGNKEKK